MNYFKQFDPRTPKRCYVNGETHLYLGKQYRLRLEKGGETLLNYLADFSASPAETRRLHRCQKLLSDWYSKKRKFNLPKAWNAVGKN